MAKSFNVRCHIKNETGNQLSLNHQEMKHGKFVDFPCFIDNDATGEFYTEGTFLVPQGVEGKVVYHAFDKTLFIITFQANVILANQGAITIASSQGGDPSHYRAFQTRSDFVTPKANYPQDASFHVYYVIRKQ